MVTDQQILRLRQLCNSGMHLSLAAAKAGMDRKTAGKYLQLDQLPSEVRMDRNWRTREDPFKDVWPWIDKHLTDNPGIQAKTLLADLQRRHPNTFDDCCLRTLQRRVKQWRAEHGPPKEVFFSQVHHPGRLAASDFTHANDLNVTICGLPFPHMLYHFVLTYSNWESCTLCFSESFESLADGLQNAFWELGGVCLLHRTDRLGACVQPGVEDQETFKRRYKGLLDHYGLTAQAIQAGKGNQNGDVEQSHRQFKRAIEQALMLRGSRDFETRQAYVAFLKELTKQCNANRRERLREEMALLRPLPKSRLETSKRLLLRVESGSTIRVAGNLYSVPSRLIGERVEARLHAERVEVWYADKLVFEVPRLRGKGKHKINYRHVIDWLVRKPGAFADYRYQADMFPSSIFRMAYDQLLVQQPSRASKEYLGILHKAALSGETAVEGVLRQLLDCDQLIDAKTVQAGLERADPVRPATEVEVPAVDLSVYDALLQDKEVCDEQERQEPGNAPGSAEGTASADVPQ